MCYPGGTRSVNGNLQIEGATIEEAQPYDVDVERGSTGMTVFGRTRRMMGPVVKWIPGTWEWRNAHHVSLASLGEEEELLADAISVRKQNDQKFRAKPRLRLVPP